MSSRRRGRSSTTRVPQSRTPDKLRDIGVERIPPRAYRKRGKFASIAAMQELVLTDPARLSADLVDIRSRLLEVKPMVSQIVYNPSPGERIAILAFLFSKLKDSDKHDFIQQHLPEFGSEENMMNQFDIHLNKLQKTRREKANDFQDLITKSTLNLNLDSDSDLESDVEEAEQVVEEAEQVIEEAEEEAENNEPDAEAEKAKVDDVDDLEEAARAGEGLITTHVSDEATGAQEEIDETALAATKDAVSDDPLVEVEVIEPDPGAGSSLSGPVIEPIVTRTRRTGPASRTGRAVSIDSVSGTSGPTGPTGPAESGLFPPGVSAGMPELGSTSVTDSNRTRTSSFSTLGFPNSPTGTVSSRSTFSTLGFPNSPPQSPTAAGPLTTTGTLAFSGSGGSSPDSDTEMETLEDPQFGSFVTDQGAEIPFIVKYHLVPFMFYFGTIKDPNIDKSLLKAVNECSELKLKGFNTKTLCEDIVESCGDKILVNKVIEGSLQELHELIQLFFCVQRQLQTGPRIAMGKVPLSQLSSLSDVLRTANRPVRTTSDFNDNTNMSPVLDADTQFRLGRTINLPEGQVLSPAEIDKRSRFRDDELGIARPSDTFIDISKSLRSSAKKTISIVPGPVLPIAGSEIAVRSTDAYSKIKINFVREGDN